MTTTVSAPVRTTSARALTIGLWTLQAALAALFAGGSLAKLGGSPEMVDMFADIGAGQWFRYLVGGLELAGAIGLLIPRLAGLAALGLAALMVGATVTNVFVLDANPALPLGLMLVAGVVARARRAMTRSPSWTPLQQPQLVVPGGVWQGATSAGAWTLVGYDDGSAVPGRGRRTRRPGGAVSRLAGVRRPDHGTDPLVTDGTWQQPSLTGNVSR